MTFEAHTTRPYIKKCPMCAFRSFQRQKEVIHHVAALVRGLQLPEQAHYQLQRD